MRKLLSTAALIVSFAGNPANAQGVPTVDLSSLVQLKQMLAEAELQLNEAIAQNFKLDEQTIKMLEQIALLEDQINALREGFEEAKLLLEGDWKEQLFPEIGDLRGSLEAALRGQWDAIGDNGSIGGTQTTSIVDRIFSGAGVTRDDMTELANSENASEARIGAQANTGAMMGVAAEASQVAASESLERITELTSNIPQTDGMKAAIDLNTRMTAEMGMALANIWQLEAAQTIGMGQAGVMTAATLAEEQKYLDLDQ